MQAKDENWFRGMAAANKHFEQFGLYLLNSPKSQFGAGFNETMKHIDCGWIAEDSCD